MTKRNSIATINKELGGTGFKKNYGSAYDDDEVRINLCQGFYSAKYAHIVAMKPM